MSLTAADFLFVPARVGMGEGNSSLGGSRELLPNSNGVDDESVNVGEQALDNDSWPLGLLEGELLLALSLESVSIELDPEAVEVYPEDLASLKKSGDRSNNPSVSVGSNDLFFLGDFLSGSGVFLPSKGTR